MTKIDKLIQKILSERVISFDEASTVLRKLGFDMDICGSHHIFRKDGYVRNVSIKRRPQFLPYQIKLIKEVLEDHGYTKEK